MIDTALLDKLMSFIFRVAITLSQVNAHTHTLIHSYTHTLIHSYTHMPSQVNAFVSGGYLARVAPARVGSKLDGYVSIADYYATFAAIAGVEPVDPQAAAAGLPPPRRHQSVALLAGQGAVVTSRWDPR
jgi:hypothetical protein